MRVGVVRSDLPGPIFLADLEPISRRNASVDAPGQEKYLHYPTDAELVQAMADGGGGAVVSAAALRAAVYPSATTIDVSTATIIALHGTWGALGAPEQAALVKAIADVVAPQFAETNVAVESFLKGSIAGYVSSSFHPDSRNPAVSAGAAVAVVEDDGATDFATAHTLPTITSATLDSPGAGDVTIAGTGLGKESGNATDPLRCTLVKFTGDVSKVLSQEAIEAAGGSVLDTEIVVPASLIAGAATTTTSVQIQFRQTLSDVEALA